MNHYRDHMHALMITYHSALMSVLTEEYIVAVPFGAHNSLKVCVLVIGVALMPLSSNCVHFGDFQIWTGTCVHT